MNKIPQHHASLFLDSGIVLHRFSTKSIEHTPIAYAHQDDFYVLGILSKGEACGIIDFKELRLKAGELFVVQPGQVHRFVCSDNAEGWVMLIDNKYVGKTEKGIFDNFLLSASSLKLDLQQEEELRSIAILLNCRLEKRNKTDRVVLRLAETFVAIIAEAIQDVEMLQSNSSLRHREIVLAFRAALAERLSSSRQPSYYASLLNISTVYLNEVVKGVTGMSTAFYIKYEAVLQAKRLLVNTSLSVKQIANQLGFTDYAYFSRLFSRTTGMSPMAFRNKNLE